ncbi:MBG domain-containing protein [Prevotella sp. tf2-5]|uniref:MBG domain-containing protein n=1 Tax=Prevotella sp. tf2-5 TaxID=1761889 RepID=UPI002101637F|nr:MBG domain-containing protein [Prevotella sp. tf2-5]
MIPRPVISYNSANNQIELTHSGEDVTIYYTLDGTNPTTTNYAGTGSGITNVASSVTVKAVAVVSLEGLSYPIISPIAEIRVIPNPTLSLTSSPVVYNGSEQTPTFNVIDGETVIPESEYTITGYSNNTNAGEATVTITDSDGGNYIVYGSPTFTINPKPLTITAKPQSITYGDAPVNDGVTYGEFAAGEDENGLTGTLAYTYNYEQYGDAGEYTITPGGLSNSNYDITFVPGTLIVNKKEVGLTWGETTSFTYNGLEQAPAATATSLLNGDVIDVMVTGATNVGDHTATASGLTGTKAGNYKLPEVKTQEFTITKAPLTITASNHTITYGDVPANDGVGYSGFVNDESSSVLGGSLSYAYNYTQYGNVGEYTITPSGLTSDNYYITFTPGVLTVTPKTIGVDWTETELSYNGSEQAPTATATGLVNNDEVGVTVTGAQTNVGTDYIATASALTGEKKDNYQLPEGLTTTFTITPKSIGDGNKAADDIIIELSPEGELSVVKQGEKILVENTDYTQETEVDGDDKIITITGMGNYTGSVKALFANPVFTDPDGTGSEKAAAVYTASRDLSAPAGIEPYIVRKVNPSIGTLVISKLDYIPEDVPVLLLSNAESEGFVASPKDPSIPEVTVQTKNSNQLKVSHGGETVEAAQIYMFYKGEFVLTKAGTLGEGKYFLYNPNFKVTSSEDEEKDEPGDNPASSRGVLRIVFEDETTGIDDLKNEKTEEWKLTGWYSLDGRRLSGKPTKGGIYIHKGQKIYIKR